MLSVHIVRLKILTGTFCNCLSYKKVVLMARGKELSNSQKALIVKLWNDRESYRNISSNRNIPFDNPFWYVHSLQGLKDVTVENKNEQMLQWRFLLDYQEN